MVDAGVKAELVDYVAALFCAAGDAERACALDPVNLSDQRADRAAGACEHDGVARFRLADVEQIHVGGEAGHAEYTQRARSQLHIVAGLVQAGAVRPRACPARSSPLPAVLPINRGVAKSRCVS